MNFSFARKNWIIPNERALIGSVACNHAQHEVHALSKLAERAEYNSTGSVIQLSVLTPARVQF